jgi:hypothetical protein
LEVGRLQTIPQPQQHAEGTKDTKRASDDNPSAISQSHVSQEATKADKKENNSAGSWIGNFFELKLTDAIIAIFTIVLAIKTSGLFVETSGLRSAADKQSSDMRESIAAAKEANNVAERALIAGQRPWIHVDAVIDGDMAFDGHGNASLEKHRTVARN